MKKDTKKSLMMPPDTKAVDDVTQTTILANN
jgi:hypothetical protein